MYCTNALRLERGCQKLKQLHGKITTKLAGLSTSKETIKDLKLYCFFRLGTPSSCCQINIIKASNHTLKQHILTQQLHVQQINFSLFMTHTHPFNGPFSGTNRVSRYQKGKTNLNFIEARDSEWQWHLAADR